MAAGVRPAARGGDSKDGCGRRQSYTEIENCATTTGGAKYDVTTEADLKTTLDTIAQAIKTWAATAETGAEAVEADSRDGGGRRRGRELEQADAVEGAGDGLSRRRGRELEQAERAGRQRRKRAARTDAERQSRGRGRRQQRKRREQRKRTARTQDWADVPPSPAASTRSPPPSSVIFEHINESRRI